MERIHFGDAQGGGLGQAVQQELGDVEESFGEIEAERLLLQQKKERNIPTGRKGTLSTYCAQAIAVGPTALTQACELCSFSHIVPGREVMPYQRTAHITRQNGRDEIQTQDLTPSPRECSSPSCSVPGDTLFPELKAFMGVRA